MSAKHTAGPWQFIPADDTPGHREPAFVYVGDARWMSMATVFSPGQTEADARLISAAPDMLAALKRAQELVRVAEGLTGCRSDDEFVWGVRDAINAALAKAEGSDA